MMKNKLNLKLNKEYFLGVLAAFSIQIIFGINFADAVTCDPEIIAHMKVALENHTVPKLNFFDHDIYFMGLNHMWTSPALVDVY